MNLVTTLSFHAGLGKKKGTRAPPTLYKDIQNPHPAVTVYALQSLMADISTLINPPDEVEQKPIVAPPVVQAENAKAAKHKKAAETAEVKEETKEDDSDEAKISQDSILLSFEKIKTHFPAARIKKIMQLDEDIGKVAQATPVVVGRALEIFMANLVEAGILEAKKAGVRRISAQHIRTAVENTEQFDFLVDVVSKYLSAKN